MDIAGSSGKYLIDDALDVGSSDMYAELRIQSTQVNSGTNTGPGIRHRMVDVTGYQFACNYFTDTHGLWRTMLGVESQMGSVSAPLAQGDMVRIEAAGRTLRYKINDALVALFQDTMITNGQRGCINGYNGASGDLIRADDYETGLLTDDLVAAFIADWSAQVEGTTSGAVITPTVQNPQSGDLVAVHVVIRDAAQSVTAPAGEGWSASIQTPSQTGLESYVFVKRWGLGGQTDDTTPTFSIGTGTAGWVATALTIRNPLHATRPWATATQAIVASGSQSNAASATVTAPSVTHAGSNRTVLRLFSSADDNALNAPSDGVLIFGGTTHDSTAGNDMAQAASIREDVTLAANTGTATTTESVNGNDVSNGITLVLAIPDAFLGVATETDSATGLVFAQKSTAVGVASETDAARALVLSSKTTPVALATETDGGTALAGSVKATTVGVGTSAEQSLAATASKSTTIGFATSAEAAQALAGSSHALEVGAASETSAGLPLTGAQKSSAVGVATEAGQALGLAGSAKATVVGVAGELDAALGVQAVALGVGGENSSGLPLAGASKSTALGSADSDEAALGLAGSVKATTVGVAAEQDAARELSTELEPAAEQGQALPLAGAGHSTAVGAASSAEQALALAGSSKTTPVGVAGETDTPRGLVVIVGIVARAGSYGGDRRSMTYDGGRATTYDPDRGLVYDP